MDTSTKKGINAAKAASKRVVQKTAEATGDMIRNKTADKITSTGKTKQKKKRWKRRNLHITRKRTVNSWWLKIVLMSQKKGTSKDYKLVSHNIW